MLSSQTHTYQSLLCFPNIIVIPLGAVFKSLAVSSQYMCLCVWWLTVVCGTLSVLHEDRAFKSSCIRPLLSKTLEREKVTHSLQRGRIKYVTYTITGAHHLYMLSFDPMWLPWVCGPTEHLTAVFDDVLVAVRVLDSILS